MCVFIYIYIHGDVYIRIHLHVCMHIYIYIHICISKYAIHMSVRNLSTHRLVLHRPGLPFSSHRAPGAFTAFDLPVAGRLQLRPGLPC